MVVTPVPATADAYKTYAVSAAFGRRPVPLAPAQRRWLLRVLHSKTYGPQRANLRFVLLHGPTEPLVIYTARLDDDGNDFGGHVIGEGCSLEFDPVKVGLFSSACTAPTPLPVVP